MSGTLFLLAPGLACLQPSDHLLHFLRALGVKFLLLGCQLLEESQELTDMHDFLLGYVPEHRVGQLVVSRFRELNIELGCLVLRGNGEPDGTDQFFGASVSDHT